MIVLVIVNTLHPARKQKGIIIPMVWTKPRHYSVFVFQRSFQLEHVYYSHVPWTLIFNCARYHQTPTNHMGEMTFLCDFLRPNTITSANLHPLRLCKKSFRAIFKLSTQMFLYFCPLVHTIYLAQKPISTSLLAPPKKKKKRQQIAKCHLCYRSCETIETIVEPKEACLAGGDREMRLFFFWYRVWVWV